MTQRVIESVSESECFELVRHEQIGRFIFQDPDGPAAVPVNYGVAGHEIVFRTAARSHLRNVLQYPVAFEVDHTEPESGKGWSVLIRGTGQEVDAARVPDVLRLTGKAFPQPWGEGVHNVWISITPRKVTGRRLWAPYVATIFF